MLGIKVFRRTDPMSGDRLHTPITETVVVPRDQKMMRALHPTHGVHSFTLRGGQIMKFMKAPGVYEVWLVEVPEASTQPHKRVGTWRYSRTLKMLGRLATYYRTQGGQLRPWDDDSPTGQDTQKRRG